jgi:hypothetical protein
VINVVNNRLYNKNIHFQLSQEIILMSKSWINAAKYKPAEATLLIDISLYWLHSSIYPSTALISDLINLYLYSFLPNNTNYIPPIPFIKQDYRLNINHQITI